MEQVCNLGSITFACSPWTRARGLLGRVSVDGVLLMAPCRDIHTIGMRNPIDVAFLDRGGRVIASQRNVCAGRRLRCSQAYAVLERVAREGSPWPTSGDQGCAFFHSLGAGRCHVQEGMTEAARMHS